MKPKVLLTWIPTLVGIWLILCCPTDGVARPVTYLSFGPNPALLKPASALDSLVIELRIDTPEPTMGTNLMIKGFTGAIIGGIGSVHGAILGAFLLGIVENFGIWFLPSGYKDAIAFTVLFAFLLFMPRGILGIRQTK